MAELDLDGYLHQLRSDVLDGRLWAPAALTTVLLGLLLCAAAGWGLGELAYRVFERLFEPCLSRGSGADARVALAPYHDRGFWDQEHAEHPEPFEWYAEVFELAPILSRLDLPSRRALYLGCGTSELGSWLHDQGAQRVVCLDSCEALMQARAEEEAAERPEVQYVAADAAHTPFEAGSFDLVVDKGLLDSLSCAPDGEGDALVRGVLAEAARVLGAGGEMVAVVAAPLSAAALEAAGLRVEQEWPLHSKPREGPLMDREIRAVLLRSSAGGRLPTSPRAGRDL